MQKVVGNMNCTVLILCNFVISVVTVKQGFLFEGVVVLSLSCGRRVLIPQEAEETPRVLDFLSYIIIGQGYVLHV